MAVITLYLSIQDTNKSVKFSIVPKGELMVDNNTGVIMIKSTNKQGND